MAPRSRHSGGAPRSPISPIAAAFPIAAEFLIAAAFLVIGLAGLAAAGFKSPALGQAVDQPLTQPSPPSSSSQPSSPQPSTQPSPPSSPPSSPQPSTQPSPQPLPQVDPGPPRVYEAGHLAPSNGWPVWLKDYEQSKRTIHTSAVAFLGRDGAGRACFFLADDVGELHFCRVTQAGDTGRVALSLQRVGLDRSFVQALYENEKWDFEALALDHYGHRSAAIPDTIYAFLSVEGHGPDYVEQTRILRIRFARESSGGTDAARHPDRAAEKVSAPSRAADAAPAPDHAAEDVPAPARDRAAEEVPAPAPSRTAEAASGSPADARPDGLAEDDRDPVDERWRVSYVGEAIPGSRFWRGSVKSNRGFKGLATGERYLLLGLEGLDERGSFNVHGSVLFTYDRLTNDVMTLPTLGWGVRTIGGLAALSDSVSLLLDRDRARINVLRWDIENPGWIYSVHRFTLDLPAPGGFRYAIPALEGVTVDDVGDIWAVADPWHGHYRAMGAAPESVHVYLAAEIPILYRFPGESVWETLGLSGTWQGTRASDQ